MQKIKDLNQEILKLLAFKPFQDRRTDIAAFRGAICNQMECCMVHWVTGKLRAKSLVPITQEMKIQGCKI